MAVSIRSIRKQLYLAHKERALAVLITIEEVDPHPRG